MQMGHETKVIIKSDVIPKGVMKELVMVGGQMRVCDTFLQVYSCFILFLLS